MKRTILYTLFVIIGTLTGGAQEYAGYNVQCEDTCSHVHGIDMSHYQGNVFWETVGDNTKMAYVYLKATEGGDRIDEMFERNINLAHRYGLKVGNSTISTVRKPIRQPSWRISRPSVSQESKT